MPHTQLISPASSAILPNGLKYIVQADPANPLLCLQLYVKVGSAWESAAEAGYSHFLEHLAFKETHLFGYNQIMRHVNSLGGSINAYTDFDCTCYYLLLPSEFLAEGLKVLAELAIHASFDGEDVALEKDIIIEELKQSENDPETDFLDFVQLSAFRENPLSQPVLGNLASIRSASLAKLKKFHRAHYQPRNSFLVIAGDAGFAEVAQQVGYLFGAWENSSEPSPVDHSRWLEPELPPAPRAWRKNATEFLAYVLPELCDTHPDSDPLLIAIRYLAIGRSSRLFKRLVEEEKLASEVKVSSFCGVLSGVSAIAINPLRRDFVTRIHAIFLEEYQSLLAGKIDPLELELVKKDIINTWRYGFEGMENLANMIGAEEFIAGYEKLYTYDQKVLPISPAEVLQSMRKYWQPQQLALIHQSPRPAALEIIAPRARRKIKPLPKASLEDASLDQGLDLPSAAKLKQVAPNHYTAVLPNGMKFLYRHLPRRPISGFALATDVCQLSENLAQRGLNYLCSMAMLHSTELHDFSELLRLSREHGLSINVEQQTDATIFRGKCFHAELPVALSLLSEIVSRPAFEPGYLRLVKGATIDMLRRDRQNPASHAFFRWFNMLVGPNSPLGRYSGNISDLLRHGRNDVRGWFESRYTPERYSLAVVGSNAPEEVLGLVSGLFRQKVKNLPRPDDPPFSPLPLKTRQIRVNRSSGQAIIHLGGFAPPASDRKQTTAFHILAQILGGDMDSRLFNLIREKYGYAYQTGFDYSCVSGLGYWFAYSYCDPDDHKPCLKLMREILADVWQNGVTAEELLHAQNYLCGMSRFELESASLQAVLISTLSALGYEPEYYLRREERIRAVTLADISATASAWLQSSNQWANILL
ncbi:MAG: insulinase family protein [Candidatus Syntrophosphaera sp.]|nr:insulinase family protein [Candidatus Syntrophosphaera sp.]